MVRKQNRLNRALLTTAAIVLIIIIGGGAALFVFRPSGGQPVRLSIAPGSTSAEIANLAAARGVVANSLIFRLYIKDNGAQDDLQAGEYDLRTGMSYAEALATLRRGPTKKFYTVTIPEGLTVAETAAIVAKKTPITKDAFEAAAVSDGYDFPFLKGLNVVSLEGYLFPKTYTITDRTTARDLVTLMLRQFAKETAGLNLSDAKAKGYTLNDVVIIGSMVEMEAKLDDERALVAAVVYNRLSHGMLLQMCSTVEFALPERKESLSYKDLEVESPYNTYKHEGLPPGPIASPGLKSIEAAAHPAAVDYLYFVLTGDNGSHTFTSSYEEFSNVKAEKGL